jgi:4'-phosphopantetheinyl transferase
VGQGVSLEPGALLVRYAFTAQLGSDQVRTRYRTLLTPAEREREPRFMFERDRDAFLLAHALTNATLAELVGQPAESLRFELGDRGRPELAEDLRHRASGRRVRFNLSHTDGLVACAFALDHDVGVDVEHVDRSTGIADVAPRVFSARERVGLEAQSSEHSRRTRFFQLWTLKEAYIKAIGKGLSAPLTQITFELDERTPRISFGTGVEDDAARYRVGLSPVGTRHVLAWAIACPVGPMAMAEHRDLSDFG